MYDRRSIPVCVGVIFIGELQETTIKFVFVLLCTDQACEVGASVVFFWGNGFALYEEDHRPSLYLGSWILHNSHCDWSLLHGSRVATEKETGFCGLRYRPKLCVDWKLNRVLTNGVHEKRKRNSYFLYSRDFPFLNLRCIFLKITVVVCAFYGAFLWFILWFVTEKSQGGETIREQVGALVGDGEIQDVTVEKVVIVAEIQDGEIDWDKEMKGLYYEFAEEEMEGVTDYRLKVLMDSDWVKNPDGSNYVGENEEQMYGDHEYHVNVVVIPVQATVEIVMTQSQDVDTSKMVESTTVTNQISFGSEMGVLKKKAMKLLVYLPGISSKKRNVQALNAKKGSIKSEIRIEETMFSRELTSGGGTKGNNLSQNTTNNFYADPKLEL